MIEIKEEDQSITFGVKKNKITFHSEKDGVILEIWNDYMFHSNCICIEEGCAIEREGSKFERLDRKDQLYCVGKIKEIVNEFEKNSGDVLRICHVKSKEFKRMLKKEMLWKKNQPTKENAIRYRLYETLKSRWKESLVSWSINEETLYKRDKDVLEICEEALKYCKEKYIIYGKWKAQYSMFRFTFYFYKKENRKIYTWLTEEGRYPLYLGDEKISNDIKMETKEEIQQKLLSGFEKIIKQERLIHLCEEKPSPLFAKYLGGAGTFFGRKTTGGIWDSFRKKYSYDELEREILLRLEKNERVLYEVSDCGIVVEFLTHYFVLMSEDGLFLTENTKKGLLEKVPKKHQKKCKAAFSRIEQKKTGSVWLYIKNILDPNRIRTEEKMNKTDLFIER